jgi:tetratricopeptide (TPR) repeat protein
MMEAEDYYRRSVEILEALHQVHAENVEITWGLARVYTRLGTLLEPRGETAQVLKYYNQAIQLFTQVIQSGKYMLIHDWVNALKRRFFIHLARREWDLAGLDLRRAVEVGERYLATGVFAKEIRKELASLREGIEELDEEEREELWRALGAESLRIQRFLEEI